MSVPIFTSHTGSLEEIKALRAKMAADPSFTDEEREEVLEGIDSEIEHVIAILEIIEASKERS